MPITAATRASDKAACLVLLFKAPFRSKRRLASSIGDAATTAAGHLLACALEDAKAWPGPVVLAPADVRDAEWLKARGSIGHELLLQHGGSLGERINHIDQGLRARGFDRFIYIGADCPALDRGYLAAADAALGNADAVLGPAADGGVVLMAARRPWPDISPLAWSTPRLLDDLAEHLSTRGWLIAALRPLADVDSPEDLAAVAALLANDARPARRAFARWLAEREHGVSESTR